MEVIRASALGMCFGVRDALDHVHRLEQPEEVTIHGDLVHNEEVVRGLSRKGFRQTARARMELPLASENLASRIATRRVVITAHGISDRDRQQLSAAGKELLDTTCPLVRRVHLAAQELQRQGYFVLVIGRPGHVEVEGITGDLDHYAVVPDESAVRRYAASRLGIVCQSTTPPSTARRLLHAIEDCNPDTEIRFVDTICQPTRERQEAVQQLLDQVDALVVVGGRHSNNTRQLVNLAVARGIPALHVQTGADLDRDWFASFHRVGLTAGTSTPDESIDEVHRALLQLEAMGATP